MKLISNGSFISRERLGRRLRWRRRWLSCLQRRDACSETCNVCRQRGQLRLRRSQVGLCLRQLRLSRRQLTRRSIQLFYSRNKILHSLVEPDPQSTRLIWHATASAFVLPGANRTLRAVFILGTINSRRQ